MTYQRAVKSEAGHKELTLQQQSYVAFVRAFLTRLLYSFNSKRSKTGEALVDRDKLATYIPRWAARFFAAGNGAAIGGFLAVCITRNNLFLLVIAAGLAAAAIGLRAAERAISDVQH